MTQRPLCERKEIIWDWNGTLFDDTRLCLELMNEQLIAIGKQPLAMEEYRELFDFPVRAFYERIGFDFSRRPYHEFAQTFISAYAARRFECLLHDGVRSQLARVDAEVGKSSVLSAYNQRELRHLLAHYGIINHFTTITGLDDHFAEGKSEQGKRHLQKLGADPRDVVMVGDTTHDFHVARTLGVGCVLVAQGHHTRKRLEACGCAVVDTLPQAVDAAIALLR